MPARNSGRAAACARALTRGRERGFTLVELLVVMAVLGLLATGVVLTLPPTGAGGRDAASRFAARAAAARDAAVLTGRPTGLWVSASGYGFEQLRGGRWRVLEQAPLKPEDWGHDVRATLSGDQVRVRFDSVGLPDRALDLSLDAGGRTSRVVIAANGDLEVP